MNIFVDTSALYALVDTNGEDYADAAKRWRKILAEADLIVTSSYVVTEAIALLHARFGTSVVRTFVDDVLPPIEIDWADQCTHDAAVNALLMFKGKSGPSLTDCANIEVMRRLRIHTIFAYDKHYIRPGITVLGG